MAKKYTVDMTFRVVANHDGDVLVDTNVRMPNCDYGMVLALQQLAAQSLAKTTDSEFYVPTKS